MLIQKWVWCLLEASEALRDLSQISDSLSLRESLAATSFFWNLATLSSAFSSAFFTFFSAESSALDLDSLTVSFSFMICFTFFSRDAKGCLASDSLAQFF